MDPTEPQRLLELGTLISAPAFHLNDFPDLFPSLAAHVLVDRVSLGVNAKAVAPLLSGANSQIGYCFPMIIRGCHMPGWLM
jgi:hypothetical protein